MSKIFIHLGAHKTASSFIQANLRANAAVFEKQGWRAVDFQTEFKKARRAAVKVRGNRGPSKEMNKNLTAFFDEMHADPRDIFLSYEGFLGTMSMRKGAIYPNHAVPIKMLMARFSSREIQVGFCIRNFADQIESSYSFRVAKGRMKTSFDSYTENISPEKLSWLKIIESLSDTFGRQNLVLWTYEDFKKDGVDGFRKIVQASGVQTEEMVAAVATPYNVSPNAEQVKVLKLWHEALHSKLELSRADTRRVRDSLSKVLTELPRAKTEGLFRPKKRRKLTRQYERDLAIIRERWGDRMLNFAPSPTPDGAAIPQT